jgi:hypothetical protein
MTIASRTSKYWVNQMVISGVAAVLLFAYGVLVMMFGGKDRGLGLFAILGSFALVATFVWVVRAYRRMSAPQRAIYAWAIMQQYSAGLPRVSTMSIANRAKDGTLRPDELQWLIDLDRSKPYPGDTRVTQTGV